MDPEEIVVCSNAFGKVSNKRLVLNHKSGSEDIPINQISSISFKRKRNYFFAISGLGFGLILLGATLLNLRGFGGLELLITLAISTIGILAGIANWIGHHLIVINISGKDRKPIKVEMSKTKEGYEFVKMVKKILFE